MSDGDVFELRLDHPNRSALDPELVGWLGEQLDAAGDRPILLCGTQDAFCAGVNLKRVVELDHRGLEDFLCDLDMLVERLWLHPAPVVAAVDGHAIAGGCVLMQCAEWRVLRDTPRLKLGVNEVALGACFPARILRITASRLPAHARERVLLGAELFGARQGFELGLADELVPDAEPVARERLAALCAHPRETYAQTKLDLRRPVVELTAEERDSLLVRDAQRWDSDEVRGRMRRVLGG